MIDLKHQSLDLWQGKYINEDNAHSRLTVKTPHQQPNPSSRDHFAEQEKWQTQ